jgi:hypothetical protein
METLLVLIVLGLVVEYMIKRTFIGKTLKLLWQCFVGLTKLVCFAVGRLNAGISYLNKKLEPEKPQTTKKSNVIDFKKVAKSHK